MSLYTTKEEAKKQGFTHNASYYGLPCYIGGIDIDDATPILECKIPALNVMLDVLSYIEGFISSICYPDDEPCFRIKVKGEL